jgi:predicted Zn-dependent peptidase
MSRAPTLRRWAPAVLGLALATTTPAAAQQQGAVEIPIETYKLGNGLRVILSPDRTTPVVAVDVWYDVGSRNERPGRSGFAHLFEHMMFQGSQNVAKGEHMTLIERAGGSMNGSTTEDRTNYFQTLPSNRLNLGLWLEADRMRSLAITEENFTNQREVVKEERRLRIDNSPYGTSFLAASYDAPYSADGCFAYAHSVIGSMDDLNAAHLSDVQQFFDTYYAPNNATLTVVGDFDSAEAKQLIEQYFGQIPSGPAPPPVTCENPFSKLPLREVIEDQNANLPALLLSYGTPATGSADDYALTLLASVLGQGESSRLNQRLVKEAQAALQVQSFFDERRGPGLFMVFAIANQGVGVDRLETLIEEEIAKVRDRGITSEELEKAKMQYRAQTVRGLQTVLGRAERLQYFAHWQGDPAAIRTDLERYAAVTAADVQRVAREYLVPKNRATVITQPAAAAKESR